MLKPFKLARNTSVFWGTPLVLKPHLSFCPSPHSVDLKWSLCHRVITSNEQRNGTAFRGIHLSKALQLYNFKPRFDNEFCSSDADTHKSQLSPVFCVNKCLLATKNAGATVKRYLAIFVQSSLSLKTCWLGGLLPKAETYSWSFKFFRHSDGSFLEVRTCSIFSL